MKRYDILTVGDLCVDLVLMGEDLRPGFGQEEKLIEGYALRMGGSCSIFSCQAAKLGMRVGIVGVVGDDAFGRIILDTLQESGVDISLVRVDSSIETGISVHLQEPHDRSILTYLGTIEAVRSEDVSLDMLHNTRHLHIGSYFLLEQMQESFLSMAEEVRRTGGTVSLDTNWDPQERWGQGLHELLENVDVFLPNENELQAITGTESVTDGLERLKGVVPIVTVKLGGEGAMVQKGDELWKAQVPEVEIVDTIGAGDSFDAGFLAGFLEGKTLSESLAMGCACGTASVTAAGGTAGQPWKADIDGWLEQIRVSCVRSC
ncbi:MAG: sugar kinase [Firmicutes bacterium]|nr:sugar kinase [Bacillota bacterium]